MTLKSLDRETTERRLNLWFFRDLTEAQRQALFRLCFHPVEIEPTHAVQQMALCKITTALGGTSCP